MVYWTDCPLCGEGHPLFNGDEDGDIFFCKQERKWYLRSKDGLLTVKKMEDKTKVREC